MSGGFAGSNRKARLPANWRQLRAQVLARDPVCVLCRTRPSTVADHIVPMTDRHELEHLQGVCDPCHRQKTAREAAAARAAKPGRRRPPEAHPGLR
ncbi:endonuclease [Streptomyces albus subsp. albus]|nr:endonuclease [Streptomyces albus subsp. albus]